MLKTFMCHGTPSHFLRLIKAQQPKLDNARGIKKRRKAESALRKNIYSGQV